MRLEGLQIGRYRLLHLLGTGNMGEVYQAEDARIERKIAIKVVRNEATPYGNTGANQAIDQLFLREVRAIARLDHPNILPLLDYGEEHLGETTFTYIVMPFREEGSLASWLGQRGNTQLLPLDDISFFLRQAADALQHAHDHGIIHRDVKPSNFLLRRRKDNPNHPDLQLADFGIAKFHSATSDASATIRGTPTYMAPEQWRGYPVFATDQYALAIMIYQLLVGAPPFRGTLEQMMYQHFNNPPPPPSSLQPLIPPEVDSVMLKALAKDPAQRFSSVAAFAEAFAKALPKGAQQSAPAPQDVPTVLSSFEREATPPSLPDVQPGAPTTPGSYQSEDIPVSLTSLLSEGKTKKTFLARTPFFKLYESYKQGQLKGRNLLLIGLALLVVAASVSAFLVLRPHTPPLAPVKTPTPGLSAIPYPPYKGRLVLNDPLHDNTGSYNWGRGYTIDASGTSCTFIDNAYHVIEINKKRIYYCTETKIPVRDFVLQVDMSIISGDQGGVVFRLQGNRYYFFRIGQDGSYFLKVYTDGSTGAGLVLAQGKSKSINAGLKKHNTLAIVANGSSFTLYVNNNVIGPAALDNSYSQGALGLVAEAETGATEVAFSNLKVWAL
ncbi:MAG TPA: protein kinase [Ktedonosporobacter sp.]|jgi:serine/threonine protein kinase|nr:protein kinase [Ktedonosporobacter sp.]